MLSYNMMCHSASMGNKTMKIKSFKTVLQSLQPSCLRGTITMKHTNPYIHNATAFITTKKTLHQITLSILNINP